MSATRTLSDSERLEWLRLARSPNVGNATFATLIRRFGSARAALDELPRLIHRGGGEARSRPAASDAARELEQLASLGGRIVCSTEPDYPPALSALDAPPPVLSVIGDAAVLRRDMIAIVGARNASAMGRKFAGTLADDLSGAGLVVVSGMARGIDSAAHAGALKNGTCAVVAGGVDYVYPPENENLYREICAQGAVVSELPLGLVAQARHFPRRNRIISGLARGVVVIEAAEGSGSLITANFALEQNREIFAVPGSPLDPRAKGTNRLLREGAILTESAADVMAVLSPILGRASDPDLSPARSDTAPSEGVASESMRRAVEEALGPTPVDVDELVRQTSFPAGEVMIVLLELELAGRVTRQPGNRFAWA